MAKILVTGSSGLVGSRFVELFPHPELLLTPDEVEFNLLDLKSLKTYISLHQPDVVINFAAFTDVGAGESQRGDKQGLCWRLNVDGVGNLVSALASQSTKLIQISTDMVFSGSDADPGPYSEDRKPEQDQSHVPWYGFTKYQGELAAGNESSIVRFSNPVRANFPGKLDYFRKPLKLFDQEKLYPMFNDQHITISFIDEIALGLQKIIEINTPGIFHISSPDMTTPFAAISYLLAKARHATEVVTPSSVKDLGNPVRYPEFGGLSCLATEEDLHLKFSTTHEIVEKLVLQGLVV
jgi:dTDP-4-dehydrorhamnose reductase